MINWLNSHRILEKKFVSIKADKERAVKLIQLL